MATGGLNGKISGLAHLQSVPTKRWCSRRKNSYQPLILENRKHDHNYRQAALRTGTHAAFHQEGIRSERSKQKPRACPAASFFLPLLMMPDGRKKTMRTNTKEIPPAIMATKADLHPLNAWFPPWKIRGDSKRERTRLLPEIETVLASHLRNTSVQILLRSLERPRDARRFGFPL